MPHQQDHLGFFCSGHHGVRIRQASGHGFFNQYMLAVLGAHHHLTGVQFSGRCQVNRIQTRMLQQGIQALVNRHIQTLLQAFAQACHRLSNGHQFESRMLGNRR